MKRIAVILTFLAVLSAACGGDKKDDAVKTKDASSQTDAGENAQGSGDSKGSTATTAKGGSKGKTSSTTAKSGSSGATSSTTTTKPHRPIVIKLDKTCVRRGLNGDLQGLNVDTDPEDTVAYSTEYSNHENELTHPQWQKVGGSGYGKADSNGKYHGTWHVPDDAPTGTATLHIIAQGAIQKPVTFKVVGQLESC